MKKLILVVASLLFASAAIAQTNNSTSVTSGSNAGANNQGNAQSITFNQEATVIPTTTTQNVVVSGTQTVRNVPSVSGVPLTTSNDTCMGSSTGSANGPGFGLSVGTTWSDTNCKMLKNSRELWNMGMRAASLALMCTDEANKNALELTGFTCPTKQAVKPPQAAVTYDVNDPYIAARMAKAGK